MNILLFYISVTFLCSSTNISISEANTIHSQIHCNYSDIAGIKTLMKIEELLV